MSNCVLEEIDSVRNWFDIISKYQLEFSKGLAYAATSLERVLQHNHHHQEEESSTKQLIRQMHGMSQEWSRSALAQSEAWEKQCLEVTQCLAEWRVRVLSMENQVEQSKAAVKKALDEMEASRLRYQAETKDEMMNGGRRRSASQFAVGGGAESYWFKRAERRYRGDWVKYQAEAGVLRNFQHQLVQTQESLVNGWGDPNYYQNWKMLQGRSDSNGDGSLLQLKSLYEIMSNFIQDQQTQGMGVNFESILESFDSYLSNDYNYKCITSNNNDKDNYFTEIQQFEDEWDGTLQNIVFGVDLEDLLRIPRFVRVQERRPGKEERVPIVLEKLVEEIESRYRHNDHFSTLYCTDPGQLTTTSPPEAMDDLRYGIEAADSPDSLDLVLEECPDINVLGIILMIFLVELERPLLQPQLLDELERAHPLPVIEREDLQLYFRTHLHPQFHGVNEAVLALIFRHLRDLAGGEEGFNDILVMRILPCLTGMPWNPSFQAELMALQRYRWRLQVVLAYSKFLCDVE